MKHAWLAVFVSLAFAAPSAAQGPTRLVATPERIELRVGENIEVSVAALDRTGARVRADFRWSGERNAINYSDGVVTAVRPGEFELNVSTITTAGRAPLTLTIPVLVLWPEIERVEIETDGSRLYAGTRVLHRASAFHADGSERPNPTVEWVSDNSEVASVDPFGNVRAARPGTATIRAVVEGVQSSLSYEVVPSPVASVELTGGALQVRTGDVQSFSAVARDETGGTVADAPISWSYLYQPDDTIAAPAGPAQIMDGRMVADVPGVYTAVASSGSAKAEYSFRVVSRNAIRKIEVVGQGNEDRIFTTDFWIWEGLDGRDYALTGSKSGDGISMVWDVTDPTNIFKTDSIPSDARTTNDVKVSPDGRWGAISREGASNRRNGVIILDLADPAHPKIASTYEGNGMTGGTHNMFATDTHLFALSAGDKYVILDMTDIYNPRYVSEYNHPGSRVHDVWVHDGLAYSAEWGTGVVVVDVGNGKYGGTIENPKLVTTFPTTTGSTHAIFPYYQESTGRFLLIVGDERTNRRGLAWEGTGPDHRQKYDPETGTGGYPRATSGYTQIFDFSDPLNPVQLARYEVSEYGTHNMWVEDDVLYQAYYEGGIRMVDISGDLMGNLYTQGREMAVFKAHDPVAYIPNAPGAWSVMPWKGNIFFSDINSGMWSVRMAPPNRPIS